MRSFAAAAIFVLALGVSADPFAEIPGQVDRQAPSVEAIHDHKAAIIHSSELLEKIGNEVAAALATYGTPEFQENMRKQVEAVAAANGDEIVKKQELLKAQQKRADQAKMEHDELKKLIEGQRQEIPELEHEKEKNDALVTEQVKLLVEAESGYKRALEVASEVEAHLEACPTTKADGARLQEKIKLMKQAATEQGGQIAKLKQETINARASANSEERLTETFSEHNNFADAANKAMGSERVLRDDQYPSLLDEASAVRLRASSKTRARARARSIPATAEAKAKLQELKESMLAREAYLGANLEKLANLKYGPTDEPTMLDKEQVAKVEEEMKDYDAKMERTKAIEAAIQKEREVALRMHMENQVKLASLDRLIKAQKEDVQTAKMNAAKLEADIEDVDREVEKKLPKMKACQEQAMELAVEAAALKCIAESSSRIITEELTKAQAESDAAHDAFEANKRAKDVARKTRELEMVEYTPGEEEPVQPAVEDPPMDSSDYE